MKPQFKLPIKIEYEAKSSPRWSSSVSTSGISFEMSDDFGNSYSYRHYNNMLEGLGFDSSNTGTSVPWIAAYKSLKYEIEVGTNGDYTITVTSADNPSDTLSISGNIGINKHLRLSWILHYPAGEEGNIDEIRVTNPNGGTIYPSEDIGFKISSLNKSNYQISGCDEDAILNINECTLSCPPGKYEDSINPVSAFLNDSNELQLTGCHDTPAASEIIAIERLIEDKNVLHFDPSDTSTYPLDADNKLNGTYTSKENRYGETYALQYLIQQTAAEGMTLPCRRT